MKKWGMKLLVGLIATVVLAGGAIVSADEVEGMKTPEPAVAEAFTIEGEFVRIAYNNVGFVSLGYRLANSSVAEEWMLLEVGLTLRGKTKAQTLNRSAFGVQTPDGATVALASQKQFMEADLRSLDRRADVTRDSINYFPPGAKYGCTLNFFADTTQPGRGISYDQVSLDPQRACAGRLYFHFPEGIQTGQYYLNVMFEGAPVQVPFTIMTKAQEKEFKKKWKTLKQEHDAEQE